MLWDSFVFCFLLFLVCPVRGRYISRCKDTDLVLYNLVFETHWTRQLFPKQYPETRPPAHWSKVIGITHDDNYVLFRIGEVADKSFKEFAETGKTEVLSGQKNLRSVLDEFSSSSIKAGAGRTQVDFFTDGNHSLASLAVKIIPSPDWFVGVDSLALCVGGTWLDSITIEASPIDAGTDSGFTFTAPNWETEPQERISRITSKWPRHPANSFYYPKLEDLPVIATFHIVKMKMSLSPAPVLFRSLRDSQHPPKAGNEGGRDQEDTTEKKFYQLKKKVEIREPENSARIPSNGYRHDGRLSLDLGSDLGKRKRRKFRKFNAKAVRKLDGKQRQQ